MIWGKAAVDRVARAFDVDRTSKVLDAFGEGVSLGEKMRIGDPESFQAF